MSRCQPTSRCPDALRRTARSGALLPSTAPSRNLLQNPPVQCVQLPLTVVSRPSHTSFRTYGPTPRNPPKILGLRQLPSAAGRGDEQRPRGPRFSGRLAHRRRQIPLLSSARLSDGRSGRRRLAADLAHEGSSRRPDRQRRSRGLRQQLTISGGAPPSRGRCPRRPAEDPLPLSRKANDRAYARILTRG